MAAIAAALGHALLNPSQAPLPSAAPRSPSAAPSRAPAPLPPLHRELRGTPGEADGVVPDGVTVLDDGIPAVANLDANLLEALDIGPADAAEWLSEHGAGFGLCRIYRNEPWHYELRTEAIDRGCPRRYADPTQDPRMRP
ncbi:hypothetical protein ACIQRK_23575 [Streptomyces anulatus]